MTWLVPEERVIKEFSRRGQASLALTSAVCIALLLLGVTPRTLLLLSPVSTLAIGLTLGGPWC